MANQTKDAIFRFQIVNGGEINYIEHQRPVPTFLCQPDISQQASKQFYEAFVDVISFVTSQHHDECVSKFTSPCAGCGGLATDALKSPINYLHLFEPVVVIQIIPVCGSQICRTIVRKQTIENQNLSVATAKEVEKSVYLKMPCNICKAADTKRCAGCGKVAYCGLDCQKDDWKAHKSSCGRKKLKTPTPNPTTPYEVI